MRQSAPCRRGRRDLLLVGLSLGAIIGQVTGVHVGLSVDLDNANVAHEKHKAQDPWVSLVPKNRPSWWTPAAELALLWDTESVTKGEAPVEHPAPVAAAAAPTPAVIVKKASSTSPGPMSLMEASESHVTVKVNGTGAGAGTGATLVAAASTAASNGTAGGVRGKQPLTTKSWFAFLRFTLSFAFVIKTLCMASNVVFQVSPFPMVRSWREKQGTGEADAAPFVSLAYGGCQWCFYGLFAFIVTTKSGFLVLVYSNVCGATLGIYYVIMYGKYCSNEAMRYRYSLYLQIAGAIVAVQAGAMLMFPAERALFFVGLVSSVCSVVVSFSMLATVPVVLATKCSKSMPLPCLLASLISAFLWITCGVLLWDPWITFPNLFGVLVVGFALGLCYKYPADGSAADGCTASSCESPLDQVMICPTSDGKDGAAAAEAMAYGTMESGPYCCAGTGETGGT